MKYEKKLRIFDMKSINIVDIKEMKSMTYFLEIL